MKGKGVAAGAGGLVLVSAGLFAFLGRWEGGAEYTVYADRLAVGLPTVCRGITRHVTTTPLRVGAYWGPEKCEQEERAAIERVQRRLLPCFTVTPPQRVFDAASSHAWNFGVAATCGSASMRAWNRSEWVLGCRRLEFGDSGRRVWSFVKTGRVVDGKPEYKFVQGLANRRGAERAYCEGRA